MARIDLYKMRQRVPDRWNKPQEPAVPPITSEELSDMLDEIEQLRAMAVHIALSETVVEKPSEEPKKAWDDPSFSTGYKDPK
jgi:hypothetical protein